MIESRLDNPAAHGHGARAERHLATSATTVVLGDTYGKVRAMFDDKGHRSPRRRRRRRHVVLGLSRCPWPAIPFGRWRRARGARHRRPSARPGAPKADGTAARRPLALESIFAQVEAGQSQRTEPDPEG